MNVYAIAQKWLNMAKSMELQEQQHHSTTTAYLGPRLKISLFRSEAENWRHKHDDIDSEAPRCRYSLNRLY